MTKQSYDQDWGTALVYCVVTICVAVIWVTSMVLDHTECPDPTVHLEQPDAK